MVDQYLEQFYRILFSYFWFKHTYEIEYTEEEGA